MARSKEARAQAKRDRSRASYIRKRVEAGKETTEDQRRWLAEWDQSPHGNQAIDEQDAPASTESAPAATSPAATEAPPGGQAADDPPLPPPPPPPKTFSPAAASNGGGGRSNWRDKYRGDEGGGGDGREDACLYLGSLWHGALKGASDALREAGIDPVIDVESESFKNSIVITLDNVLPDEAKLSPEMVAVGGTTMLMGQRWLHREKIKMSRAKKRGIGDIVRESAPTPPSRPAPEPMAIQVHDRIPLEDLEPDEPDEAPPPEIVVKDPPKNGKSYDKDGLL